MTFPDPLDRENSRLFLKIFNEVFPKWLLESFSSVHHCRVLLFFATWGDYSCEIDLHSIEPMRIAKVSQSSLLNLTCNNKSPRFPFRATAIAKFLMKTLYQHFTLLESYLDGKYKRQPGESEAVVAESCSTLSEEDSPFANTFLNWILNCSTSKEEDPSFPWKLPTRVSNSWLNCHCCCVDKSEAMLVPKHFCEKYFSWKNIQFTKYFRCEKYSKKKNILYFRNCLLLPSHFKHVVFKGLLLLWPLSPQSSPRDRLFDINLKMLPWEAKGSSNRLFRFKAFLKPASTERG